MRAGRTMRGRCAPSYRRQQLAEAELEEAAAQAGGRGCSWPRQAVRGYYCALRLSPSRAGGGKGRGGESELRVQTALPLLRQRRGCGAGAAPQPVGSSCG